MAYPGEYTLILSGGRPITGWQVHKDKIRTATLPVEEDHYYRFRELFLNGKRQIRARYPNYDPQNPITADGRL